MQLVWSAVSRRKVLFWVIAVQLLVHQCAARAKLQARVVTTIPAPISIPPSQDWDGNDGPWSSFTLQVGTPAQAVKVFISTGGAQTFVVAEEGCQPGEPLVCPKERGGLYNYTASTTWVSNLANASNNIYALDLDSSLGFDGNGRYGFDDITLGFQGGGGPTLKNQTLAGIAAKPFFLGLFGLAAKPSVFLNQSNAVPSFMQNLKNQSRIPSLSWGYTAGNQYRLKSVLGSLTLGGYDKSRIIPNNATFSFSTAERGELAIQLQSISLGSVSLLPSPITTYLDSSVPYLYLPVSACSLFETAFGLTWNNTAQLYFISDTQRVLLQAQNPSVVFTLGAAAPNQVNISMPYSAFDLTASWPLVPNDTRYFPLKRANDSSQYTLGRVFFQEAYLTADYERGNFSVSQCKWDSTPQELVPVLPPDSSTSSKDSLSTAAIAGIAAGGAFVVLVVGLLLFFCWWQPRRRKSKVSELPADEVTAEAPAATVPIKEYYKPELDSNEIQTPRIEIHEADGKRASAVEMGNNRHSIYELPEQNRTGELSASPVSSNDQSPNKRFSWMGPEVLNLIRRSETIGTGTFSSISSGWGSTARTLTEAVSPETPQVEMVKKVVDDRRHNRHR